MNITLTSAEYLILRRTIKTIFEFTDRSQVTADLLGIDRASRATIERILHQLETQSRKRTRL